ncbi:MAG TPA: hypothetical protein PLS34_07630 [Gammaproteobacteria bacterium]|nr:hypothetical protein [Gammaproteobacteria bacterium]
MATSPPDDSLPNLRQLGLFALAAAVQVSIIAIGRLWLRFSSPEEAGLPPDERDEAIERRAIVFAYYVLIGGVIIAAIIMPFYVGGWEIVNAAILAIVVAELVQDGLTITGYRRLS